MKKLNKFLNFYIIFVIVLTSLALALFLNVPDQVKKYIPEFPKSPIQNDDQIEDETIDWQTYENEKYGYKVKYPKDWFYEVQSVNEDSQRRVIFNYEKDSKNHIAITVDTNNTLEKLSKELSSIQIYNAPPITQERTKLHGLDAIYSTGDLLGYKESIFFEYNKKLFKIEYYTGKIENKDDYESDVCSKMMDSFEFTNP